MAGDAAEILKESLALPTGARAAIAGSLLDSLDTDVDEDAEAVGATEVNRRVAELDGSRQDHPRRRSAAHSPRADALPLTFPDTAGLIIWTRQECFFIRRPRNIFSD